MTPSPKSSRGSRSMVVLGLTFIVGIFAFVAVFRLVDALNPRGRQPLIAIADRTVGKLTMPTLEGGKWSLEERAGKVVVVNYFATWCGPCREEMLELIEVAKEYGSRGVEMAALSLDLDEEDGRPHLEALKEFQNQFKLPFPILVPPRDSAMFAGQNPVPQTFLIDKHGRTAQHIVGVVSGKELRAMIEELLKEP